MERDDVGLTEVRRRFHPCEEDADMALLRMLDDLRQVAFKFFRGQPAQAIIPAERDNEHTDITFERPVQSRQTTSRGVSRHARVYHFVLESFFIETLL